MGILALKETEVRGHRDFPVEAYPVTESHPRYVMPVHWHGEYEIIQVISGTFQYTIGQVKGTAGPGEMLFVGSGVLHGGMPHGCEYHCIVFDAQLLRVEESDLAVCCRLPAEDTALAAIVDGLFHQLVKKPRGYELQAQGFMYQFFGRVMEMGYYEPGDGSGGKKWVSQLKEAISLIEQEYAAPLTLSQLAQAAGMSKKYFCHFFRQMTRYSPIAYLNRHRVEVACYRLMAEEQSVTELAFECGFNDLSYFIRVFKGIVGVTPKQYAMLHRAG